MITDTTIEAEAIAEAVTGYLEAALWADLGIGGQGSIVYPRERLTATEVRAYMAAGEVEEAERTVAGFIAEAIQAGELWPTVIDGAVTFGAAGTEFEPWDIGANLYYDRAGHGIGFWDTEAIDGEALANRARALGEVSAFPIDGEQSECGEWDPDSIGLGSVVIE